MELFKLDDDESYDKRCGEIFLTTKGSITFHCTLCEGIYKSFDAYAGHLSETHLKSSKPLEDSFDVVKKNARLVGDSNSAATENTPPLIEVKMESSDCGFLREDEVSIDILVENFADDTEEKNEVKNYLSDMEYNNSPKEDSEDNSSPTVIRRAKKPKRKNTAKTKIKEDNQKKAPSEKMQNCLGCSKTFKANADGKIRLHNCQKGFLCFHCGRSFMRNSHLNRHLKRHNNQRDYKCDVCDKAFFDSTTLKNHVQGHSTERPYKCNICPATFPRDKTLRNHMKLHENKREYKCNLCGDGFNQQAGLFTHMKVTHRAA